METNVPRELIEELKDPRRKRTVKTILRENWTLVEDVDKSLKSFDDVKTLMNLPVLVAFILQNFLTTVSCLVSPKRVSVRKQRSKHENEEVVEFEDDLREAQKDWKAFFEKYEETIQCVVDVAKQKGKVDFHGEVWQRTRFQKLVSSITNFSEKVHSNTVHYIPPTRFIFALITFTANWTVFPVVNVSQKIANTVTKPLTYSKPKRNGKENGIANGNGIQKAYQNGKEHVTIEPSKKPKNFEKSRQLLDENFSKFHVEIENTGKFLSEKEREWQEKTTQFQKEVRARLEVQEKRLIEEIETFEEEKMERRRLEEEEFESRMRRQNEDFELLMGRIEEERKALEAEEHEKLLEICESQDKSLLDLLDSTMTSFHWTDHEDYWNDRLQILRNSLSSIRSEYWNFESYLKQSLSAPDQIPNFVKVVCKMESASFGRRVTRAKAIIDDELEFFDALADKYADDLFLRVLKKIADNVSLRLEKVILELWNVAVDAEDDEDLGHLRAAVLDIDPYSIPTTWRLKGMCNSVDPRELDECVNGNGSVIVNGHF